MPSRSSKSKQKGSRSSKPKDVNDGSYAFEPTSRYASMEMEASEENLKYADYNPDRLSKAEINSEKYLEDGEEEEAIYIVRQDQGYLSILFSVCQTIILGLMMWQCGIAPLKLKCVYPLLCL
jgi:hypothetical protein